MWYNDFLLLDMGRCKNKKRLAKMQNNAMHINVFMRLFDTALQRYRFTGLPDTVNQRVVLQSMICYGNVTFFDQNGVVLCLPSVPSGDGFNINGDPVKAWVFSRNGIFNKEIALYVDGGEMTPLLRNGVSGLNGGNRRGVMIWESMGRYPFLNTILYYAQAISDTMRTIDVARKWLKSPFIPVCEQSLVESVKAMITDITDNNELVPVSTGVMDITKFNILPVQQSPDSIQTATELVDWYENQYRALCGMHANTNLDKKGENLIADEIHSNDAYTDSVSDTTVRYINKQLELVNAAFGLDVRCVENPNFKTDKGGDNNEKNAESVNQ